MKLSGWDAFKIAQRHGVTPVLVQLGGKLAKEGDLAFTKYAPGKVTIVAEDYESAMYADITLRNPLKNAF